METWIAVGGVLLVLLIAGVALAGRKPRLPSGPAGFGPSQLTPSAAASLLEAFTLHGCAPGLAAEIPLSGAVQGIDATLFDVRYPAGDDARRHTVLLLQQDGEGLRLPVFSLRPQVLVDRQPELAADDTVSLGDDLDARFQLSAPAQGDVALFFGRPQREALAAVSEPLWVEAAPGRLAVVSAAPLEEEGRDQMLRHAEAALGVIRAY